MAQEVRKVDTSTLDPLKAEELFDELESQGFRFSHKMQDRVIESTGATIKKSHIWVFAREARETSEDDVTIQPDDVYKKIRVVIIDE